MPYHVAEEECADPAEIAALQRRKLQGVLQAIAESNGFYRRKFANVPIDVYEFELDQLPFTTRDEIESDQLKHPPYGTLPTLPQVRYTRLHQTSGTGGTALRWLDTPDSWEWWKKCWGIIYRAAGVNRSDRIGIPFSFGPFIGFWGAFESAVSLGNFCLPCGGMTTQARLTHLLENDTTVLCCTPTYALRMAETAEADGINIAASAVRIVIVAGEPGGGIPAVRSRIESAWNARVFDHAGMTEIGPWGFECLENPGGMHILETEFIAEMVDPKTLDPVPDGTPGELVLTNLGRLGMPLLRYRTGDRVTRTRGQCACGRWFARVEGGVTGRLDDMLWIRGNNVYPSAIEAVVRLFDEIAEYRLIVRKDRSMQALTVEIEPKPGAAVDGLATRLAETIRDRHHFRPEVVVTKEGALPRFEMKARRVVIADENEHVH